MFDPKVVVSYRDIIAQLMVIREKLIADYHGLYLGLLDTFIDRVHIFKTHFASLDIRQDHSKHHLVVETVLKREGAIKESLSELGDKELQRLLLEADYRLRPSDFQDPIVRDTLENIQQLAEIQAKNGEEGCNRYIISNSEDIYS